MSVPFAPISKRHQSSSNLATISPSPTQGRRKSISAPPTTSDLSSGTTRLTDTLGKILNTRSLLFTGWTDLWISLSGRSRVVGVGVVAITKQQISEVIVEAFEKCGGLILDSFQDLLKAVNDDRPENVFTSTETFVSLLACLKEENQWVDELAKRKRGQPEHLSNTSEAYGKTKIGIDKEPHSEDQSIIKLVAQGSSVPPPDETVRIERRGWPHEEKETNKTIENSALGPRQAISSEKNEFDAPLSSEEKPLKSGQKCDPRGAENEESSPKSQGEKPKEGKTKFIIEKDLPGETSKKASEEQDLGKNLTASKIKFFWPEDEAFYEGTVDSYDASIKKHKVLYDDGDLEVLFLKEKCWELVKAGPDRGKALDFSSPAVPLEILKDGKSGTTAKTKTGDEAKEATPKAGSQLKNATPQSSKSKDATPKSEDLTFSACVSCYEGSVSTSPCYMVH